jgi:hypothetical protein
MCKSSKSIDSHTSKRADNTEENNGSQLAKMRRCILPTNRASNSSAHNTNQAIGDNGFADVYVSHDLPSFLNYP